MLVVSISLCALVSLVYSDPQESLPAVCVGNFCYSLHREERKFNMARGICKKAGGDAMTVRTTVAAEAMAVLMQSVEADPSSHFWLGLQLHQKTCPSNSSRLMGYRWVNGDNDTDYTNWGSVSEECGPRCVAFSGKDRWVDRRCNKKADGVLCEYRYNSNCEPLTPTNSSVTYLTPFGAWSSELTNLPQGTVAEVSPGDIRLRCNDTLGWVKEPVPRVCLVNNGGCQHICQEGPPLKCSCRSGYRLDSDELSCQPVDPCGEEQCAHSCQLQQGKPVCSCESGYRLDADHKTCIDIDECLSDSCPQLCENTPGSFQCRCKKGYQMSQDGKCEDINECKESKCSQRCSNTEGSFTCFCTSGYEIDPEDRTKCVWYCNSDSCPAHCYGDGCTCPPNFILDDSTQICHDIDECQSYCLGHICSNSPGSFKCECRKGYELQLNGNCEPEGSGDFTLIEAQTSKPTTYPIPASAGLSLSVVLGTIFAIAVLTLICAGVGHHLLKKRGKWQTSTKYKSANAEEDVNLSQVTTGEDCKHQYSNEKCNVGT